MTPAARALDASRLLLLGLALGAALHAAWPVFAQWYWCQSGFARFYESLLVLLEERESRRVVPALAALLGWLVLTLWARRIRSR